MSTPIPPVRSSQNGRNFRPSSVKSRTRQVINLEALEQRTLMSLRGASLLVAAVSPVTLKKVAPSVINFLTVPGQPGEMTTVTLTIQSRLCKYRNEMGLYPISDATGRVGQTKPGSSDYLRAALEQAGRAVIFRNNQPVGTIVTVSLPAGSQYGLYLVANGTTDQGLARNNRRPPFTYFSVQSANPDRFNHLRHIRNNVFAWEDFRGGGDRDFNDLIFKVSFSHATDGGGGTGGNDHNHPPVVTLKNSQNGAISNHNVSITGQVVDVVGDHARLQVQVDQGSMV